VTVRRIHRNPLSGERFEHTRNVYSNHFSTLEKDDGASTRELIKLWADATPISSPASASSPSAGRRASD
jgi:hypothetical protein